MAEVYRARGVTRERLFALKLMRPQLAMDARFVDMFHREARLAMLLKHDCIVNTVDVGEVDGCHYIAMEYIGGRDLGHVLNRCLQTKRRIPVPLAVYIGARLAEGLHFAHTLTEGGRPLNLVNRDVSASNVRLSYDGAVKLLDFGIARTLMKFTSEIGTLKGKFSYMSPEQIRGMPVDARSDVFSAGILLHEMLTTTKLFRGDTEFELMERVRTADISRPSTLNRRVSADVDAICLKALERDVADRFQTAAELATALDSLLPAYRFDPKELQTFMRELYTREYSEAVEQTRRALEIEPAELSVERPSCATSRSRARRVIEHADTPTA